jgi:CheY-like chemotaxis protein
MKKSIQILLAEDDPDDVEFFLEAMKENNVLHSTVVVMQGDEVIPHLENSVELPEVILLDLNLPKVHGKEILKQLK